MPLEIKEGETPAEGDNPPANDPAPEASSGEAEKVDPANLTPDSEEYAAYFIAKGRGEDPDAAVAALKGENKEDDSGIPPMPENGHEKFYNKETGEYDWRSHAVEADYNKTRKKDDKSDDAEGDGEEGEGEAEDGGEVADLVAKAGLKVEDLQGQIMDNGQIDDSAKDALVKTGIPLDLIEEYETLAVAYMETVEQKAYSYVGGEDKFQQMTAWAAQNLDGEEKGHINGLLKGPNWQSGVDTLRARYEQAVPNPKSGEVNLVDGDGAGKGQAGYKDRAQMMSDMRDPRYQTSEAFRQEVAMKIKNASW